MANAANTASVPITMVGVLEGFAASERTAKTLNTAASRQRIAINSQCVPENIAPTTAMLTIAANTLSAMVKPERFGAVEVRSGMGKNQLVQSTDSSSRGSRQGYRLALARRRR